MDCVNYIDIAFLLTTFLLIAITTFEEARRSDIENERLPPATRERMIAIHQESTHSKLRDVANEEDTDISHMADIIASAPERTARVTRNQI